MNHMMKRRQFLKTVAAAGGGALLGGLDGLRPALGSSSSALSLAPRILPLRRDEVPAAQVAFVKTTDHAAGVKRALDLLEINPVAGKWLFLKPNFNSSDPFPGSTHVDTLQALVEWLQDSGADHITLGDRSGMGLAQRVMESMNIPAMAGELGFDTIAFENLATGEDWPGDWVFFQPEESHWQHGFGVARPVLEADGVVQTCCLKTHGYGGHYTLSLKNSVGMVAKTLRLDTGTHDFMDELHNTRDQRRMIAEINLAYTPDLIVLDGIQAFKAGGPATGVLADTGVVLAGTDRVAIDAVGVALLRLVGTTFTVSNGRIFETEQIARAVELGLGVDSPDKIEFITGDDDSAAYAAEIQAILLEQG
jgi:uncharacterized protein (DUF362 family)